MMITLYRMRRRGDLEVVARFYGASPWAVARLMWRVAKNHYVTEEPLKPGVVMATIPGSDPT